jgi:PAS domain S-box-containing protein
MKPTKILIVEDEILIALEIETRLKKFGFEVCGKAVSSEEALSIVESENPGLILMDIMIKGTMDGIQTATVINKKYSVPIIYLTAFIDQVTLDRAKKTNPFGYLAKPIQERDLLSTIEMALYKSRTENELKITKNWLQTTLASIGDGVIVTDAFGIISFMNPVAEKMTGWLLKDALNFSLPEIFKVENELTGERIENLFEIVNSSRETYYLSNNVNLIPKAGEKKSIIISLAPMKDDDGKLLGSVLVFHDNSERKKVQEKLLLFAHAIKNISDSVTITDLNNNLVYVNEAFERIYGYTFQEAVGKNISLVTYYSEEFLENIRENTVRQGWSGEVKNKRKDGSVFPVALKTSTIFDDNGNPIGLVGIATDITDRKHAEERIKQSEKDYRGLFESAQDAIVIFYPEGEIILDVNEKACEMYGYAKDQFVGMSLEKISINIKVGKQHLKNTLKAQTRYQFEIVQKKIDGSEIDVEISASVITYKNSQAILSINRDITARKLNEKALKQSEEKYRNLFETMAQGVIYQSADGKILSANMAAERILGFTSEQMQGLTFNAPIWKAIRDDGSDYPNDELPGMIALQTGNPIKGKIVGVYKQSINDYTWILIDSIPEFQPDEEKPFQVFSTFSDITKLRRAEIIQQSFYRISEASSSAVTLEGLFESIHSIVRQLIQAENLYIALYDRHIDVISFPYFVNEKYAKPNPRKLKNGLADSVIRENKSISISGEIVDDTVIDQETKKDGTKLNHWLGVPLRIDEEVIGAVVVQKYSDMLPYSAEEEKILTMISTQIAHAIQRKIYSDALFESEEKYRTIFNSAPIGIFQSGIDGKLITVNKACAKILGYDNPEDIYKAATSEFYVNKTEREKVVKKCLKDGSIVDAEIEWWKVNGEKIWIELTAYLMKSPNDTEAHFEGFIKDVTQRKHDQEIILQLSSGIEQSPTSVIITDLDGNIQYTNPRFSEISGYTFDEVKGKNPRILKSGKTDSKIYADLWATVTSGKQWRGEFLNRKKNGELFWELAFIFPLSNSYGEISQYLGIKIDITERKTLETELKKYQEHLEELIEVRTDELRLSEQKFKALAENSDDLIIRFNSNCEVLYTNPAVSKAIETRTKELVGNSFENFGFSDELNNLIKNTLAEVFNKKEKKRIEFVLPKNTWIDWLLIPEFDRAGKVATILTFGRDITNMKSVENELFRRDRLLQGVAAASNRLFTLEDFDTKITNSMEAIGKASNVGSVYIFENRYNPGSKKRLPQLVYSWQNDLIPGSEKQFQTSLYKNIRIFEAVLQQLQTGKYIAGVPEDFSKSVKKIMEAEGIKYLIQIPIEVFGKFWGFIGFNEYGLGQKWNESEIAILSTLASDIGGTIARKIIENQLRSSEERLKILFDYAPEAYFMLDYKDVFIDGNKETELIFGYTKEELIEKKQFHSVLFSEEYFVAWDRILSLSKKNIPTGPDELEIIRKDGKKITIELNTYPVIIGGKQLVLGAAHNISLRKKAEEEIRNALKHSQDLNQMKSRFVSMVSHEFRTPLSTILSSLELLEYYNEKLSTDEKKSHFAKITRSVDYLTDLLDDVITINKADSGRLEVKYSKYDVVKMINQLINELKESYVESPSISLKSSSNAIEARVDEKLFRQIISNLVSNAIKYTSPDKKIEVNLFEKENHFIFEIRDEGVGIPVESQKELFTPFYRASNIGNVPGSGLGLAITKRSVDLLNGQIEFSSRQNEGTTFKVILPIHGDNG